MAIRARRHGIGRAPNDQHRLPSPNPPAPPHRATHSPVTGDQLCEVAGGAPGVCAAARRGAKRPEARRQATHRGATPREPSERTEDQRPMKGLWSRVRTPRQTSMKSTTIAVVGASRHPEKAASRYTAAATARLADHPGEPVRR